VSLSPDRHPPGTPLSERAPRYALYLLVLLTVVNFINYIDRQVIVAMYDQLRQRFAFSDVQIGALTTGFFLVHALTTVPFGWASDHYDRRRIMAAAVFLWSLATLGSAVALGFVSMLIMRGIVGVGEAAYGPVSNAVLAESFAPERKARVIAIYNIGMFVGAAVGMAVGARLGFPDAFLWVGVPGLVLAFLVWFLRIPARRPGVQATKYQGFVPMLRQAWGSISAPTLRWMVIAGILVSFSVTGYLAWFLDFVIQVKKVTQGWLDYVHVTPLAESASPLAYLHGWGQGIVDGIAQYKVAIQAGKNSASITYGAIAITAGGIGVVTGGKVADWLQARRKDGRVLTIAIGFFAAVPCALVAIYAPEGPLFYVGSWLMLFFVPWYNGPMAAVIDDVVDDDQAATAQASFTFFLHLFGSGPAALIVGLFSDLVGIQHALLVPTLVMLISGVFVIKASKHVHADMQARQARAKARAALAT
jgi:predicted MFS family arabinose efflux permease